MTDVSCCIALFTLVQAGLADTKQIAGVLYLFDNKVCGQSCPKLVAPDNMHSVGELHVNIRMRVFQPSHLR